MKNTILLFLILLSTAAASQTNIEKQERWTLGLSFSPDIYYNTTTLIRGDFTGYEL